MHRKGRELSALAAAFIIFIVFAIALTPSRAASAVAQQTQQPSAPSPVAKRVGAIKAISGNTITLAPDTGPQISVLVEDSTHIFQIAPGEKDLKSATPIHLSDLQPGDRILVAGKLSDDAASIEASAILAMKRSDVEAKQQAEREAWQHGVGGLVKSVDSTAGTISISVATTGGIKDVAVLVTTATTFLRYAPDSVNFADAMPSSLGQIKPGDQLRARGARSADGTQFAADAIVSGSFRNIAGTITSLDTASGTMTVMDLITKKPVTVKITSDSQLRKFPPETAQRIAIRLKGAAAQGGPPPDSPPPGAAGQSGPEGQRPGGAGQPAGPGSPAAAGGYSRPAGGQFDFQQIVNRMPAATLADFQKGDAVMIVSTESGESGKVTAISLLGGVEPILAAAPSNSQAMTLSPWSLGGEPAGGDADASP
ncbi:MAG: DUF5666 domain-containing protein [Candidatus Acidiferrales bacterium]